MLNFKSIHSVIFILAALIIMVIYYLSKYKGIKEGLHLNTIVGRFKTNKLETAEAKRQQKEQLDKKIQFKSLLLSFNQSIIEANITQMKRESNQTDIFSYNIMFIETNKNNLFITPRQLCAIESAAYRNPNANVILYMLYPKSGNYSFVLDHYPRLSVQAVTPDELFEDTPLLAWYKKGKVFTSEFSVVHMSDAGRLALLLKRGGFYSDLDTVMLKSVQNLTQYNGIGYLYEVSIDSLCNSHLFFRADHPFLKFVIDRLVQVYNPNSWGGIGPLLFVSATKEFCKIDDIFSALLIEPLNRTKKAHWTTQRIMQERSKCNLTIFPERYFFPYSWQSPDLPKLFKPNHTISKDKLVDTFSLHLFGKFTSVMKVKPGDRSVYDVLALENCPRVYENAKANGLEF
jgi:lactosylceramide 4-alpha-galactosyltransferase